ncbi:MAG: ABC transporter permease [Oenococcus sp.]|uniref:ABC transporter permease n=1 Tax=Oenococcus TaxID=46254 RepID=UPI0021E8374A|nr:ABC transporter permease [Oenococcus kitaharae]MCV3295843.1 ABC transporter permease [Oenococcus kitaharae]
MNKLSAKGIAYVIERNWMSFRKLFKISIFPNLFDSILYLAAMGFGIGHFVGQVSGMPYLTFISLGLVAATGMNAANAESTTNAYIQMRLDKTYYEINTSPINLEEIIVGQALWAGVRATIFGSLFLLVTFAMGILQSWAALFIPIILFLTGTLFGFLGLTFTLIAPTRDYLNYYSMLVIQPMYMFSNTFFPLSSVAPWLKNLGWFSPLTHAVSLIRQMARGTLRSTSTYDFIWLLIVIIVISFIPQCIVRKKLNY